MSWFNLEHTTLNKKDQISYRYKNKYGYDYVNKFSHICYKHYTLYKW